MKKRLYASLTIIFLWSMIFSGYCFSNKDEILLVVHDREITASEFLYYYQKNLHDSTYQDIDKYLEVFIDMQLKLAQAREEKLNRNISFVNELAMYRIKIAEPYLTHQATEEKFAREAYERLKYEVKASHILVKINNEEDPQDTLEAYKKAMKIRERALKGESFEKLALTFSEDQNVKVNSGDLGYFTAFQSDYNFETVAYNMKPGEISLPVRTQHGYHIIKFVDKRDFIPPDNQEIPPYDKAKRSIIKWIKNAEDIRIEIIQRELTKKLKKEWNFTENPEVLKSLIPYADERIYKGDWNLPESVDQERILCTIDGKNVYIKDFVNFISEQETDEEINLIKEYFLSLYDQFVTYRLTLYENYKLDSKYPEFRNQYWEYRDAMLLLAITNKQVWLKSTLDTIGLVEYFEKNKNNYTWDERLVAGIYTANDRQSAQVAMKQVSKILKKSKYKGDWFTEYSKRENKSPLSEQRDTFLHGDNPLVDGVKWKRGIYGVFEREDKDHFVIVYELLQPSGKTFAEAQAEALDDYQEYLMKTWLEDLHAKYSVQVDQEVLQKIKSNIYSIPVFQTDFPSPTADKPQSKLWYMHDSWWALIPRSTGPSIWQRTGKGWIEHPEATEDLKEVPGRADVWLDRNAITAVGVGKQSLTVFRVIAGIDSQKISWRSRILAELIPPSCIDPIETATIAQDGIGDWWVATVVDAKLYVWSSSSVGRNWSEPILLAQGMDKDDICVITPIPGGVGVIWSDQVRDAVLTREHKDGNPPENWGQEVTIDEGNKTADDHFNTSLSPDGTLWVTSKSSLDTGGKPQFVLRVRSAEGKWINKPYLVLESRMKRPSRPVIMTTEDNSVVLAGHGDNDRSVPFPHNAVITFSVIDTSKTDVFSDPQVVISPFPSYNSFIQNVTGPRHPFPTNAPWIILASDAEGRVYEADLKKLVERSNIEMSNER